MWLCFLLKMSCLFQLMPSRVFLVFVLFFISFFKILFEASSFNTAKELYDYRLYLGTLTFSLRLCIWQCCCLALSAFSYFLKLQERPCTYCSNVSELLCLCPGWRQWLVRVLRRRGGGGDQDHSSVCGCPAPCARAPAPAHPVPADHYCGRRQIPLGSPGAALWAVRDQNCDSDTKHRQG